jgi:FkbM family methyltransferase
MHAILARKIRVALTPRSSLLWTRLENGARVAGYNRPGHGGRGVYIYRDSLEPELSSLPKFLRPGSVFADIGANVGVYTMKAAKEVGENGLVIAVEPFIESARRLSQNVVANGFKNVRLRNVCIGARTEHTCLYLNRNKPNSFGLQRDTGAEAVSVLSVSLDDLCRWERLERLDYLKIDAEGAEALILQGGVACIERLRPIIQVEITLARVPLPSRYRRFAVLGGVNNVFIPAENAESIGTAEKLGWRDAY